MKHPSQAGGYRLRTHSPEEWFREFGQRYNDGFAILGELSNEYRHKQGEPIPMSTAGKFFLAGYGCNNLPNWRTTSVINRLQNDRAILNLLEAPKFQIDLAQSLVTEALIENANIRFAGSPNQKDQVDSLKNLVSRDLPESREGLEKLIAEPPLIFCEYARIVQDNFYAQFERSKFHSATDSAISEFLGALGVTEGSNIIASIAAIDDFGTTVLPLHADDVEFYGQLMTSAYQRLLQTYLGGKVDPDNKKVVLIGQHEINCEQLIRDLFKDGTDLGIYVAVLQILQDLGEANYHAVSNLAQMSAKVTPSPENIKRTDLERHSGPVAEDPTFS